MKRFTDQFWKTKDIPPGVRIITLTHAVLWIGWGFAETLIPVLIYSFSRNFAQAGLIHSTLDIVLILVLPIVGIIADKMRATSLIFIGFFLYALVGTSYFLVGITGYVLFIILARVLNGVSYAMVTVGRETYFRRHIPSPKIATAFGYFDTIANFWWIVASVAGIALIKYFSIPTLLFLIVPASLIASLILWAFKKREVNEITPAALSEKRPKILKEISEWNWTLKSLMIFNFFIASAGTIIAFFLPIEVYKEGANLNLVIIMGIISAIPMLFGMILGKWFDIKGSKVFAYGLSLFALLIVSLGFFNGYIWQVVASFLVGIILELLSVGSNELITTHANPEHFGKISGTMESISNIGNIVGPLAMGILIDSYGISNSYLILGIIMILLAASFSILTNNVHRYTERK